MYDEVFSHGMPLGAFLERQVVRTNDAIECTPTDLVGNEYPTRVVASQRRVELLSELAGRGVDHVP